jgi:hypothetical protein
MGLVLGGVGYGEEVGRLLRVSALEMGHRCGLAV